jgi:hypothetical protein
MREVKRLNGSEIRRRTMKKYYGTDRVKKGIYLNLTNYEMNHLYEDPAMLPGNESIAYIKLPTFLAAVGGPVAGLALVIFLPLVGVIGLVYIIFHKIQQGILSLGRKTKLDAR